MPSAVFVPAALTDLTVDVQLTGVARGDLFFRGQDKWNNLAAGSKFSVLTAEEVTAGVREPRWNGGLRVTPAGLVGIGTGETTPSARFHVKLGAASEVGQIIQLAATPTGDALRIQSSGGSVLALFDELGKLGLNGVTAPSYLVDAGTGTNQMRLGSALLGSWPGGSATYAFFGCSALNQTQAGNYALIQDSADTLLNAPTGGKIWFRINNEAGKTLTWNGSKLLFPSDFVSRKLVFYEDADNDHQFWGYGINTSTLRFQIGGSGGFYRWYRGDSSSASTEIMQLAGDAKLGVGAIAGVTLAAHLDVRPTAAGNIGVVVRLTSSPTADALQVQDNGGSVLAKVDKLGTITQKGQVTALAAKTAAYTITTGDRTITGDASGGAFTVTLPAASSCAGQIFTIKKTDSSINALTVAAAGADTIDGSGTYALSLQWKYVALQSTGSGWIVIANN